MPQVKLFYIHLEVYYGDTNCVGPAIPQQNRESSLNITTYELCKIFLFILMQKFTKFIPPYDKLPYYKHIIVCNV